MGHTDGTIDCGAIMKICKWAKCRAEFEPVKDNQEFCKPEHRHAHNNWLKMTGIHLCPGRSTTFKSLPAHGG